MNLAMQQKEIQELKAQRIFHVYPAIKRDRTRGEQLSEKMNNEATVSRLRGWLLNRGISSSLKQTKST